MSDEEKQDEANEAAYTDQDLYSDVAQAWEDASPAGYGCGLETDGD